MRRIDCPGCDGTGDAVEGGCAMCGGFGQVEVDGHAADFATAKDFLMEVRDRLGIDFAKKIIDKSGYSGLAQVAQHGNEATWTGLVQTCAVVLAFTPPAALPFAPPLKWVHVHHDFERFRRASDLMGAWEARAVELGCVVLPDSIITPTKAAADELGQYWTELWAAAGKPD